MNENAKLWVETLESGSLPQTYGRLRDGEKFCCLGVACKLYAERTGKGKWGHGDVFVGRIGRGLGPFMPAEVMRWLGLQGDCGWIPLQDGRCLSILNDSGKTFPEIAAIIREHAAELFVEEMK